MADQAFDVIVAGGGLAGHCAALAVAEAGADVLLLEKEPVIGGSTILSGGLFAFADTPLQRAQGIEDSADLLYRDLRAVGGEANDPALVRAYADGQRNLFDWLVARGMEFRTVELSAGQSVPRSHQSEIGQALEWLAAHCAASGRVTFRSGMAARRLQREGNDGPVTGVQCDGATFTARGGGRPPSSESRAFTARGGVILATGGFSHADDLLAEFAPTQAKALRMSGAGNVGDGLRMAWRLGAGVRDTAFIKGTFGAHARASGGRHEILLGFYRGAVVVNTAGRRFVDESLSYKLLGDACLRQPGGTAFQVFDQQIFERSDPKAPMFDFQPALARGLILTSDTLEGLAGKCGIAPLTDFMATIARYNAGAAAGRDTEFSRDGLCNHVDALIPIARPPFYAYPSTSVVLATYCGLTTAPNAQVVDVFGEPITGLYAAGEIMGGFHGTAYMTGSSLGKAAFFGRAAGCNAAARAA